MTGKTLWTSPNGKWSIVRADPAGTRHPDSPYAVAVVVSGQEIGYGWVDGSGRTDLEQTVEVEAPKYVKEKVESLLLKGAGKSGRGSGPKQKRPEYRYAPEWKVVDEGRSVRASAYERGRDAVYQLSVYTAPHGGMTYYEAAIYARTTSGESCAYFNQGYTALEYRRAMDSLTGDLSLMLTDFDRIVDHVSSDEFFALPGSGAPGYWIRSPKVYDPLGFSKGVMPKNPPKPYIAVVRLPNGDVAFTHEFPRKFLIEEVVPDALEQSKGQLLDIIPLEDKQRWIDEHRGKGTSKPTKSKGAKR